MQGKRKPPIFQISAFIILVLLIGAFFYVAQNEKSKVEADKILEPAKPLVKPTKTTSAENLTWPANQTINAAVLMYHHIGTLPEDADEIRKGLTVSLENFEAQMKYLKENGYVILTMKKMYALVAQGKLPAKVVILTFDDGYQDNYLYAEPVLEKYGFKATFNIITGKIGQGEYMTAEEVIALHKKGHELASHTVSHPSLEQLSGDALESELVESKSALEKMTSDKVITICYPAGKYDSEVEIAAKGAGYKMATTTAASKGTFFTSLPYEIPRYRINPTTRLDSLIK